jgi:leucyl-tRNA synthetase
MFSGRYEEGGDFSDQGIEGVSRFLHRVWELVQRYKGQEGRDTDFPIEAQRAMHRTIKKVGEDLPDLKFNTAVAALMEYSNDLHKRPALHREEIETLLLLLAPLCPYITEELWEQIGCTYSVHQQSWPEFDADLARAQEVDIAVQINGKTRDVVQVEAGSAEDRVVEIVRSSPRVQRHLDGQAITRTIFVPDRLVNFVIK